MDNRRLIVLLICLGNITITFNIGAVAAAIPIIAESLGQPDLLVSKIVAFYMIPYGLGALLYAPLTRFVSYRWILCGAMALYAAASAVTALSVSLTEIFAAQVVAGIAAASSTPLSLMIIGDFFDRDLRGRLVGTYFGCSFLASTVGMVFMGTVHWRWLFLIPAAIGLITAISFYFLGGKLDRRHTASVNYIKAFSKHHIRNVFILIFALSFLYHAVHKWYGVYLSRVYGFDKLAISFILILVAACGLFGQQIGGYLSDKKGRITTGLIGVTGLGAATMLLVGYYPVAVLIVILAVIAISWTVGHNAISTVLTDFPVDDRPIIASLNSAVRFVSGGLGFYLSGFLVEKSFGLTFFGIGVLMLISSFFFKKVVPTNGGS